MDAGNPQGPLRLAYGLGGYVINPSEFVSTAAADAALRIASDIIGSTLAHADELTRSTSLNNTASTSSSSYQQQSADSSLNPTTGELNLNDLALISSQQRLNALTNLGSVGPLTTGGGHQHQQQQQQQLPTTSAAIPRGSRELLGAAEDLLGATQRVIATADQPTIDLFEQTLNDFHALTLRNIVDSSDDDDGLNHQRLVPPHTPPPPPTAHTAQHTPPPPPPTSNGQRSSSTPLSTQLQHDNNLP